MGKLEDKNRTLFANYQEIKKIVGKLEKKMDSYDNSSVKKLRNNGQSFNMKNSSNTNSKVNLTNFASSSVSRTLNSSYEENFWSPKTNASNHNPNDHENLS